MTETRFHQELEEVREDLANMAGMVELSIHHAMTALVNCDAQAAREVIDGDRRIDLLENEIDQRCIALLATQQPVAVDLRFLASTIKVCSFLERMGDQSVNLAWRARVLSEICPDEVPPKLHEMARIAREMTGQCLDAFLREDCDLAYSVLKRDDDLDRLCREFLEESIEHMAAEQRVIRRGVEFILASRHLERIGDGATNVAEEVVYLVEGRVIRHGGWEDQDGT